MAVTGFRCAACGAFVGVDSFAPWRCPRETGDRRHVLLIEDDGIVHESDPASTAEIEEPNPFVRFRHRMAWYAFARSRGMSDRDIVELVRITDDAIAKVDGTGFRTTPLVRREALETEVLPGATVWIKDETGNVGRSHKARHLMSIVLHLRAAETSGVAPWRETRPRLAISSCGNAAIAAATLAAALEWPIEVFIPEWAGGSVVETLDRLGATVVRCPRRNDDPPGDPTVHRFRAAVAEGAIPFSVQGPENALCLDGGRTIGWEMAAQLLAEGVDHLDAAFVQVGGGAFAASLSRALGEGGVTAPLIAVQTEGCAPLYRAFDSSRGENSPAADWARHMWPWESEPSSLADGILDDETYDWVADVNEMVRTGGRVVIADERTVVEASRVGPETTDIDASPTGTAGLAGLMTAAPTLAADAHVALVFSGVRRS
jgi:threonine synthase